MRPAKFAVAVLALVSASTLVSLAGAATWMEQTTADNSSPLGDWRGESICVVRESACHDEDSLYHVTNLAEKPGWFSIKLDKIVNGKAITMGSMVCSYNTAKQSLNCEFPRGVMRFIISANKMEGTMTLPDGTLWRKLSLMKSAQ